MGLFQQRSEEDENQWVLPSEPLARSEADMLGEVPSVDSIDFAFGNPVTSIVFPVAPPAPEAADAATGEPED